MTTIQDPKVMQADPVVDLPPAHVAIIMDGNGRWAQQRNLPRVAGHKEGVAAVRTTVETCAQLGVGILSRGQRISRLWRMASIQSRDIRRA